MRRIPMKYFIAGFGLILLVLASCQKERPEAISPAISTKISDLVDQTWVLEHHNFNGIENIPPQDNYVKYLEFSSDSTFVGYTGCNLIHGIYHANDSGEIFFFSVLNVTGAPCPPGTDEWHDIISNQLLATHRFKITPTRLELNAGLNDTIDMLRFIPRNP